MTAPAATAGDGLQEAIAEWLFRKVIHRDGLIKVQWEHLVEPQITGWLEWADELLALPAFRDVLAAAARDAETIKGLAEFATDMINAPDDSAADWGYDLAHRLGLLDVP